MVDVSSLRRRGAQLSGDGSLTALDGGADRRMVLTKGRSTAWRDGPIMAHPRNPEGVGYAGSKILRTPVGGTGANSRPWADKSLGAAVIKIPSILILPAVEQVFLKVVIRSILSDFERRHLAASTSNLAT